jgi:hypothetical protein
LAIDMFLAPDRPSTKLEILLGRSLAACVHPVAAWRSGSRMLRWQCIAGYFVASYLLVLTLLLLTPLSRS